VIAFSMKNISYDQSADAVYFRLKDGQIIDSESVSPGVVFDYDENNQVVVIELLSVSKRTPEELKNIDFPFEAEDKQQLRELFNQFICLV